MTQPKDPQTTQDPNRSAWIRESERAVIDSPFIKMMEQNCRSSEDGRKHRFYILRSRDFANIIPITAEGNVVLVRQWRVGISGHTLEVPGGVVDGEDHDAQASAIREMREETGYTPLPGARCVKILSPYANPAIMDNRCHSFVIGPVAKTAVQKLDYGEMIDVHEVPIVDIPRMILNGEIENALILTGLFALTLQTPEGTTALVRELNAFRAK